MVDNYRRMTEALAPFVDLLIAETLSTSAEARAAASAAVSVARPIWIGWTVDADGVLLGGETVTEAANGMKVHGVLANCAPTEAVSHAMPEVIATGAERVGGYANGFTGTADGLDIETVGLDELGTQHQRDDWRAAARFLQQYFDVLELRDAESTNQGIGYDNALIIQEAVSLLRNDPELLDLVERVRTLSKHGRAGETPDFDTLAELLRTLPVGTAVSVARAFSHFLSFANIAEQHHRIRRRRECAAQDEGHAQGCQGRPAQRCAPGHQNPQRRQLPGLVHP